MAKIIVLGGGRVGNAIALIMSSTHYVTVLDLNITNKKNTKSLRYLKFDFNDLSSLAKYIVHADLMIGAIPGHLGYKVLKAVIEVGKNIVDISFFPENGLRLNSLAKKNKVIAAIDCGVAPGMDNILLGHYDSLYKVISFKCMVGGLPLNPIPPFNYKAPFSPIDVIEEYIRLARLVRNGKLVILPALTENEIIKLPRIGRLEAFNSDGLRSLVYTMSHIPDMVEKTLRYPGHRDQMYLLRELGLLNKNKVKLNQSTIAPIQLTSRLLFDQWTYQAGEKDITAMRVELNILGNSKSKKIIYDLYDSYDDKNKMSSMARTTGITACAVAECILKGTLNTPGIIPPEYIGQNKECFDFIMSYQKKHGIEYKLSKK